MDAAKVPGVLAVMATAGLYDDSGKWLYATGLPAKSGVGGGLIAVSPGKFGIAVVSPPLDDAGNSVKAQRAITDISNALGGNPYAARAAQVDPPIVGATLTGRLPARVAPCYNLSVGAGFSSTVELGYSAPAGDHANFSARCRLWKCRGFGSSGRP